MFVGGWGGGGAERGGGRAFINCYFATKHNLPYLTMTNILLGPLHLDSVLRSVNTRHRVVMHRRTVSLRWFK